VAHGSNGPRSSSFFVPIFLPMLTALQNRPNPWGTLVFVNLPAAFTVAAGRDFVAFYLKGVATKHVHASTRIFAGMMPYMLIVIMCMVIMYLWPE